jgi:hypothetical protein
MTDNKSYKGYVDTRCSIMYVNVVLHGHLLHWKQKHNFKNWVLDSRKWKAWKKKLYWILKIFLSF